MAGTDSPALNIHAEKILILDCGGPGTQLLARCVRAANVYCEIRAWDISAAQVRAFAPRGIILAGAADAAAIAHTRVSAAVFELGVPVLGIGLGMQVMATQLGGTIATPAAHEYSAVRVRARGHSRLFTDIQDHVNEQGHGLLDVWLSHGALVTRLPAGFKRIAEGGDFPHAAMGDDERGYYGLQFHPEAAQTTQGQHIITRFVRTICACAGLWTSVQISNDLVRRLRAQIGAGRVLLGLSGGVDSSVTAALLQRAIGARLVCVFVDHGLLRLHEADAVMATFADNLGVNIIQVDAADIFLQRLAGVSDPEAKRKLIGNTFVEIFNEQASQLEGIDWLAQGTIYPDVLESGAAGDGKKAVIKSHHNVGGLPAEMQLGLVEPLRELFKDEVRELGLALGLPRAMVMRHPFPGPGLGVRILGEVKQAYADKLRQADAIFIEELQRADWYDRVSQAFAVYLPVSSVGVVDDQRRYEHVIALRAVETIDFMSARWAHLPYELIEHAASRIVAEVEGVSRVVYDVTGKPPGTIEWE